MNLVVPFVRSGGARAEAVPPPIVPAILHSGAVRRHCPPAGLTRQRAPAPPADWRVRNTAIDILIEEHPVESYIHGLIDLLYREENAGARNSAIEALIRLNKKITPFLIHAFQTSNRDVRKFIIDVLGEFKDSRSLPLMLNALKDEDKHYFLAARIMWSIYAHTLKRIERANYNVFRGRIGISKPLKLLIAFRYWLSHQLQYAHEPRAAQHALSFIGF